MQDKSKEPQLGQVTAAVRKLFPALFVLSFLVNLLLLVSAIYMLQVYDRVLSSGSLDTLIWLSFGALAALAIYGVLEYARKVILGRAAYWLELELNVPVIRRAMSARLTGTAPAANVRDVADLRSFLGGDAMLAFLDAPWSPIFLAFIWLVHPSLGMIAVGGAITLFLFAVINDLLTRKPQQRVGAELRRAQATAQQYLEGAETVSPLGMTGNLLSHWRTQYGTALSAQLVLGERTVSILSASRAFRLALQVLILGVGAYQVLAGHLTAGGMIAASIILSRAMAPIERSIGAWRSFVVARAAHRNLSQLFSGVQSNDSSLTLPRPAGRLTVENLYCVAPQSGTMILENITFTIEPGDVCAVVGPSGSGKTTLCRLLVGAWKPARGHVRLDGAEVSTWNPEDLGPYIGYLSQDVELFPATVAQNISRMRDATSEEVIKAATLAGVHELILQLPEGYDTDVGLHGGRLSGGQRQRLGLARALFGDPAFVVLDEPNSNLDGDGERALNAAIRLLKGRGATVVMVTHNASALRLADKILALKDGRVGAFDDREVLMQVGRTVPLKNPPRKIQKLRPVE